MSFSSPFDGQSHAAGNDTALSHRGSKRASPFDDHGSRTGSHKRMCFETAEDHDDSRYLAGTRTTGVLSPTSFTIETSPSGCRSGSTNNWLENSSIFSQNSYGIGSVKKGISCEDSISREPSVDSTAIAREDDSLQNFPSIGITNADLDHGSDRSSMGNTRLQYHTADIVDEEVNNRPLLQSSSIESDWWDSWQSVTSTEFTQESNILIGESEENVVMTDDISAHLSPENISLAPPYDTCYGVILLAFKSSLKIGSTDSKVSVKMSAHGDILKLAVSGSGKYAGVVEATALCTLLQNPNVALNGTLSVMKMDDKNVKQDSSDSATHRLSDCVLRVLICGPKSEKQSVGTLLSEGELYLQHPLREEVGGLNYDNPHFLLRPGIEMPSLEQLAIMSDAESDGTLNYLDEASISLVMRVFDSETAISGPSTTEASNRLQVKLKDHQHIALAMMQEKECGVLENTKFPSLWQSFTSSNGTKRFRNTVTGTVENKPKPLSGGILADEMGLGKTLSILALICWSLDLQSETDSTETSKSTGMTLVVAPKSTISGWQEQIKRHIKPDHIKYATFHGTSRASLSKLKKCNIILTTYETLRSDWCTKKVLFSQQWDRTVLDEAHNIRSSTSQTFKAACELQALHRWCLSGTPICNSLDDFGSLLTFLGVQPFAEKRAFKSWILDPLREKRPGSLNRLERLVRATCLRRKKSHNIFQLQISNKMERIHWIDLSIDDQEIYKFFKLKAAKLAVDLSLQRSSSKKLSEKNDTNVVSLINILRRICDHGECLLPPSALDIWNHRNNDLFVSEQLQTLLAACDLCKRRINPGSGNGSGCEHVICTTCMANSDLELSGDDFWCPKCAADIFSTSGSMFAVDSKSSMQPSAKILALLQNLDDEQNLNLTSSEANSLTKSLVFSVWTKMLDLVQHHLQKRGFNIARIDGSCSLQQRSQAIKHFTEDPSCTIMLASIGSAGEGIDLTTANNVHLLEPHWNPMQEAQAIDRVHRIGQQRDVHIVRYLTRNSIETYVQWIQQEKIQLINQTLDSVHVSQAEIDGKRWEKLQQYIGSLDTDA